MSSEEAAAVHPAQAAVHQYFETINQVSTDWADTMREMDRKYPNRGRAGWVYQEVPRNEEHIQAYNTGLTAASAIYDEARRVYDRTCNELQTRYPKRGLGGHVDVRVEANEEYARAWTAEHAALVESDLQRREEAKAALLANSNKLAAWLVESGAVAEYPDHVKEVLSWGPLSYDELVEKGSHVGWCNEFTRYLNLAHRAGVIEDGQTAKQQLLGKLARAGRLSDSTRALVERALAEAVAEAQANTTGEDA